MFSVVGSKRWTFADSCSKRKSIPAWNANAHETGFSVTSSVYQGIIRQVTDNATFQALYRKADAACLTSRAINLYIAMQRPETLFWPG